MRIRIQLPKNYADPCGSGPGSATLLQNFTYLHFAYSSICYLSYAVYGIDAAAFWLGEPVSRQCSRNKGKTCLCQGQDGDFGGRSYSFGCSWSLYRQSTCKFSRSKGVRTFFPSEAVFIPSFLSANKLVLIMFFS